ncbi:hypothetical protein [Methylocystis parvus]|uniref:hypothetical protein n=1 Tax=Methylocystis parvus TaxID=134 RepID=UPI003C743794
MLVFLTIVFTLLLFLFSVLAYGAIQDGLRLLFSGAAVVCFVGVLILGARLAFSSDPAAPVSRETGGVRDNSSSSGMADAIPEAPARPAPRVAPKPAAVSTPAVLPQVVAQGSSFHLEPGQSSPLFRIPTGKRAHVSVFGGAVTVYSGGVVKLNCDRRGFTIAGAGDANQVVACNEVVDVLVDQMSD